MLAAAFEDASWGSLEAIHTAQAGHQTGGLHELSASLKDLNRLERRFTSRNRPDFAELFTADGRVVLPDGQAVTATRPVTTFRTEAFQTTEIFTVCVPVAVQRPVQVQVCRMVPRTVTVRVPAPVAPAAPCTEGIPTPSPCH